MAMTWSTLTAAKGGTGSIASWVNYSKLDVNTILDEAQALLYSVLRTREMRTRYTFYMKQGDCFTALPARCLDGIGRMIAPTFNMTFLHKDESYVNESRVYQTTNGTFGTDPFTTTSGSSDVTVSLTGHGFNQGSLINIAGATAVGGLTISGSFDVTSIVDANTFVINCAILGNATSGATGGGASVTYTCDNLTQGMAECWAIWDERIQFNCAFVEPMSITLQYYQSLPLLSATNQSNFLTNRYPQLLRTACVTSAADFMKDDSEYQKGTQRLAALIQQVNSENDMEWRGMELDTETP